MVLNIVAIHDDDWTAAAADISWNLGRAAVGARS